MKKNYDDIHENSFIKGLTKLTGLSERKLRKYAQDNNVFNILEHPNVVEVNKIQLEKISMINEFIATYGVLKMQEAENKIILDSSSKSGEYFISLLSGIKDREKVMVAFLDNGNNIIETREMASGNIGEAVVYPRSVLKAALDCDCKSIILAHNHPGGSLKASKADINVTETLTSIFTPLQINIMDHIIVANRQYMSMAESGLIPIKNVSMLKYDAISIGMEDSKGAQVKESCEKMEDKYKIDVQSMDYYDVESEEEDEWEI